MTAGRRQKILAVGAALCLLALVLDRLVLTPVFGRYRRQG